MLDIPSEWNEVPDLMMEDKDVRPANEAAVKRKIYEVAQGQRKWRKEDDICLETCEHSPTVQRDSILKIGMKLYRKEMNVRFISSSCTQHPGGRCSVSAG